MYCCCGLLALVAPRVAIVLLVLFSDVIGRAYETWYVPLLGFFFLPLTTLAYTWAWHESNGEVAGLWIAVIVLAVLVDLGVIGGGARGRRWKVKDAERSG